MTNIKNYKNYKMYLLYFVIFTLSYNFYYYKNYLLILLITGCISVIYYTQPDFLHKNETENKNIKTIIESFDIKEIATNVYDVYKMPKQFKYIYIKSDILKNLINLKFTYRFNKESYVKIFILLEKFLRIFYNTIIERTDKRLSIGTMKDLHKEFRSYIEELKFNVPLVSKHIQRFKNRTLHEVIDDNMNVIDRFMTKKIKIIKALIEDKIK